jgi:DNA-binding NarL/FixJ family response regulator
VVVDRDQHLVRQAAHSHSHPGPAPAVAAVGERVACRALTRREHEVPACIGEGLSNAEIAARPEMAEGTVKTHVSRLLARLELRSRVQAAVPAQELGVRPTPGSDWSRPIDLWSRPFYSRSTVGMEAQSCP